MEASKQWGKRCSKQLSDLGLCNQVSRCKKPGITIQANFSRIALIHSYIALTYLYTNVKITNQANFLYDQRWSTKCGLLPGYDHKVEMTSKCMVDDNISCNPTPIASIWPHVAESWYSSTLAQCISFTSLFLLNICRIIHNTAVELQTVKFALSERKQ